MFIITNLKVSRVKDPALAVEVRVHLEGHDDDRTCHINAKPIPLFVFEHVLNLASSLLPTFQLLESLLFELILEFLLYLRALEESLKLLD